MTLALPGEGKGSYGEALGWDAEEKAMVLRFLNPASMGTAI
jgi:hypothetical protein